MELRASQPADLVGVRALLQANGLPVADLDASAVDFLVATQAGRLVGAIGVERHGDAGLLRSLVVAADARETGVGQHLVGALERQAQAAGIGRLVLLTQTAARFFAARGYAVIDRASAPDAVQASAEFKSLCPASATCMTKSLEAP